MGLLRDIPIYSMNRASWTISFHRPWAQQATMEGDAEKVSAHYKMALHNMIRYTHEEAPHIPADCEYRMTPARDPGPFPVLCSPLG